MTVKRSVPWMVAASAPTTWASPGGAPRRPAPVASAEASPQAAVAARAGSAPQASAAASRRASPAVVRGRYRGQPVDHAGELGLQTLPVVIAVREPAERFGVLQRHGREAGERPGQPQLLAGETSLAHVVEDLEQADRAVPVDEGDEQERLVAVAAHDGGLGGIGAGVADVDDGELLLLHEPRREREVLERVRLPVGQAVTVAIEVGQYTHGPGSLVVVGDGAEMAVEDGRRAAGDLGEQLAEVEAARQGDRGLDQRLDLALARQAGGQVIAVADDVGDLVDVFLLDTSMPARRARARQKPRGGPATDGVGRDAEAAGRELHAQIHGLTLARNPQVVN